MLTLNPPNIKASTRPLEHSSNNSLPAFTHNREKIPTPIPAKHYAT
ncbi:hypothetical protein [Acinetobacter sp. HY1485]|nr:hypothetical protein [Acinetobacter sp. HY1485]